jgi:hypothetical protein
MRLTVSVWCAACEVLVMGDIRSESVYKIRELAFAE